MRHVVASVLMVLVTCAGIGSAVAAEGTIFRTPASWQEAVDAAKSEQKFLFLDAYTDWCGWCKVMDRNTFADSSVAAFMNQHFVSVKIEMERGFGIDVAMRYRISGFPSFLVFTPDGRLVYRMFGYQPPADFLPELRKALQPETQQVFAGISSATATPVYPSFLLDAFKPYKDRKMPSADTVETWLSAQPNPYDEVVWTVLNRCAVSDAWEQWIVDRYDSLSVLYGQEVSQRVYRTIYDRAGSAIKQGDDAQLTAILAKAPSQIPYHASVSAALWLQMHSSQQRWEKLMDRLASEYAAGTVDISVVNEHCWTVYEKCDDASVVQAAINVMKPAMTTSETEADKAISWGVWDTYAALQYKAGDLQGAEAAATTAIARGEHEGVDAADLQPTRDLLAKIRSGIRSGK